MGYYTIKPIYPWLYSLYDPLGVYCYLAVGCERALLFDTAHGVGNLPEAVRTVTDKPVTVVLGHGHIDHANGAYQFEEAWLHEDDFPLCREHTSEGYRRQVLQGFSEAGPALPEGFDPETYATAGMGTLKKLELGQVFDLGGLHMEVIGMEGHTAGSVGLLAQEHRVLLDSDAANPHIWMFLNESLPVSQYIAMLERVRQLAFDTFFVGHSDMPQPKSEFDKYIRAARNASIEKAEPYGAFSDLKGYFYQEDGVGLVFNEATLGVSTHA